MLTCETLPSTSSLLAPAPDVFPHSGSHGIPACTQCRVPKPHRGASRRKPRSTFADPARRRSQLSRLLIQGCSCKRTPIRTAAQTYSMTTRSSIPYKLCLREVWVQLLTSSAAELSDTHISWRKYRWPSAWPFPRQHASLGCVHRSRC